ncbi:MAG: BatD family protein [Bacteroidetes bacterium]|nr:BatD family protein [Bacteroidota bacterium]
MSKGEAKKWPVYSDVELENRVGKLSPNDTVIVTGWSTWVFEISDSKAKGFLPWKALQKNHYVDSLILKIREQSEIDDKLAASLTPKSRPAYSITVSPEAWLDLSVDKTEVFEGECFILSLSFNISDINRVPLRFYDLGLQLDSIFRQLSYVNSAVSSINYIVDIAGVHQEGVRGYTSYKIVHKAICPSVSGIIKVPPLTILMEQRNSNRGFDKLIKFSSNNVEVKVKPIPQGNVTTLPGGGKLCGDFELKESFSITKAEVGIPVLYNIDIQGKGLTYAIAPPKITMPDVSVRIKSVETSDSLIQGKYFSKKRFTYELYFKKEAKYDFSKKIRFTYFNPYLNKESTLFTQDSLLVRESKTRLGPTPKMPSSFSKVILIDISQSMWLEDYSPFRLKAVVDGLKPFLLNRGDCDIQVIAFGGNYALVDLFNADSCFTKTKIDSIVRIKSRRGTAMGDAIFFAESILDMTVKEKKIVVIGDGDNTAGNIFPESAAELAKKYNIKIFSIGVGNNGLVPFGKDIFGRKQMVSNTFNESIFKMISTMTRGKYYWAKDSQDVTRILRMIFE